MSSGEVSINKGRAAQTSKANAARKLPAGLWSVVCSSGLYDKPAEDGTVSKSKVIDVVFYVTKEEAWEESAYLLGRRSNEAASETHSRRGRSVGGGILEEAVSMTICGRLGIGRVEGEYNASSTYSQHWQPRPDARRHRRERCRCRYSCR